MINTIKNNSQINFRGCKSWSLVPQDNGVKKEYVHQTAFLRDFATLDFTQNYTRENFPYGTHIANFACSQGQEPYSLAMLLNDANQDKKYKITGYDIIPKAIETAKRGIFIVEPIGNEAILLGADKCPEDKNLLTHERNSDLRSRFGHYFEATSKSYQEPSHSVIKSIALKYFPENKSPENGSQIFMAKPEVTQGILDFKIGDINKIGETLEPQKTGVILFKNALYHIIGGNTDDYVNAKIEPARKIFEQIHNALQDNGIFVLGNLSRDHLQGSSEYETRFIIAKQNGQRIRVFDVSKIHDALRQTGFEPIFYEKGNKFSHSHVPAIWRKIPKK